MSLIKCPECGKEISTKANACPNCGEPNNIAKANEDSFNETIMNQLMQQTQYLKSIDSTMMFFKALTLIAIACLILYLISILL